MTRHARYAIEYGIEVHREFERRHAAGVRAHRRAELRAALADALGWRSVITLHGDILQR